MGDKSGIEWTDASWNPIAGCSVISPGCKNCYAMRVAGTRLKDVRGYQDITRPSKRGPVWNGELRYRRHMIDWPLRWRKPRRIFVNSMSDLFHEAVPEDEIAEIFAVMACAPHHIFQVLTKRAERMRGVLSRPDFAEQVYDRVCDMADDRARVILIAPGIDPAAAPPGQQVRLGLWPLPNVWLGVSAEDQKRADQRVPDLLEAPAAVRFISAEPLLGPINFWRAPLSALGPGFAYPYTGNVRRAGSDRMERGATGKIDWMIVGGESGPHARPMRAAWVRDIRDQCAENGTAFFFKQWGEYVSLDERAETWGVNKAKAHERLSYAKRQLGDNGDVLYHIGRRAAGRVLDGRTHDEMPAALAA